MMDLPPGPISSQLELQVLLANQNIPEAFHHARSNEDEKGRPLLEYFFEHCIRSGMFQVSDVIDIYIFAKAIFNYFNYMFIYLFFCDDQLVSQLHQILTNILWECQFYYYLGSI